MARVDDAQLTVGLARPGWQGSALTWQEGAFTACVWGDETVVHDEATGAIHLIATDTGNVLRRYAAGQAAFDAQPELHELERIGLIRRDTPTA